MSSITRIPESTQEWGIPGPQPAHSTTEPIYLPLPYTPECFDAVILAAGLEFRYNLRSHIQQWRRVPWLGEEPEGWTPLTGWQDWTDTTSTLLRAELPTAGVTIGNRRGLIEDALGVLPLTDKQFEDAVHLVCARNAVDPFLTYVQDETPRWDRIPRLSGWLVQCFDVADGSYDLAEWAGEFVFLGPVQRALQPGVYADGLEGAVVADLQQFLWLLDPIHDPTNLKRSYVGTSSSPSTIWPFPTPNILP